MFPKRNLECILCVRNAAANEKREMLANAKFELQQKL